MKTLRLIALFASSFAFASTAGTVGCSSAATDDETDEVATDTEQELRSCTGALPETCQVCSNGKTACAHWVKRAGKCVIETCKLARKPSCASMTCPSGQSCMVMGSPPAPMCM